MLSAADQELLQLAREVAGRAYAPYSHFAVGAALQGEQGGIYTGCNVENISYGLTICAERSALVQAVSTGERRFLALALWAPVPSWPCGACRQCLAEFAPSLRVITGSEQGTMVRSLAELFPSPFDSVGS